MKKLTMQACILASLSLAVACNSNQSTESTLDTMVSKTENAAEKVGDKISDVVGGSDTSMEKDRKFVMEAASGGMMEVELGKLAATNAASAKVKDFGKMMVTDHSKANTELKAVAASKNITLSATPMEEHQKHIDHLKGMKGAEFDKAYMDMMVDDHEEDISNFESEAEKGNDAEVKAFAAKTLPVLKKHLESAKSIHSSLK